VSIGLGFKGQGSLGWVQMIVLVVVLMGGLGAGVKGLVACGMGDCHESAVK